MRDIRKADFYYPGFELAGVQTQFERGLTRLFCSVVGVAAWLFDALSAAHPKERAGLDG